MTSSSLSDSVSNRRWAKPLPSPPSPAKINHLSFSKLLGQGAPIVEFMKSRARSKDREIYSKTTVSGPSSAHHSLSPFA